MKRALFFAFLFITFLATAQTGNINGRITNILTEDQGISGTHIYLKGYKYGTITNGLGYFQLQQIPEGKYKLVASIVGYETITEDIEVTSGETLELRLGMVEKVTVIPGVQIERTSLTGGSSGSKEIPGSVHYISPKELQKFNYNDVNRILRNVPGVNVQEEDGFGLRPNIGFRGTGVERSSKITVMEDGVLMAPAPYAAPAAYYFPIAGRMQGVEIRKGSSQIKYGPYTTGGAINFVSTEIPDQFRGKINLQGGSFDGRSLHANVGDSYKNFGFMAETFQVHSDGFKELDNGANTGFDTRDYLIKFRVNTNPDAKIPQSLTFKAGHSTETSHETYLGLTQEDFDADPFRRYYGSQEDVMETEQKQFLLRHHAQLSKVIDVTTSAYRTDFKRNWYKLDKVNGVGISSILEDPNTYSAEYDIIAGANSADNALAVKANNRSYYSQGIETILGFNFNRGELRNDLELGIRLHKDQIDRFQWVDGYNMTNGIMQLTSSGVPGTESNRIEEAKAIATYLQYTLDYNKFRFIPGIRYEHITIDRMDYGTNDPERTGVDLSTRENTVDAVMPGIGIEYNYSPVSTWFLGVHKGFSPPGSKEGTKPEESVNYEFGYRMFKNQLELQTVFFFNDYSNLLGSDLAAAGGSGSGDQFNGGEANVWGLEFEAHYNLIASEYSKFTVPIGLAYTLTNSEFQNSFESDFDGWGDVEEGDELPYIAKHQFALNIGVEHTKFNVNLSSKYVSRMRTEAGQGDLQDSFSTDSQFVVDLSTNYHMTNRISLFGSLNNLTDQVYSVSRRPAGLRPGMPRSFMLGVIARF